MKSKVLWSSENSVPINKHSGWFILVLITTGTRNCFVCIQNRRFQFCLPKYRSYDNTLGNCFFQIWSHSRAYLCTCNLRKHKESSSPGPSIGKTKHTSYRGLFKEVMNGTGRKGNGLIPSTPTLSSSWHVTTNGNVEIMRKLRWKLAFSLSRQVVQVDRNLSLVINNLKTNLRWRCTIHERVMSDQRCCLLIINKKLGRKVNQPGIVLIILKTDSSLYLYKVCFVLLINQGRTRSFGRALYCRAEVTG